MRPAWINASMVAVLLAVMPAFGAMGQERRSIPPKDKDNPLTELISGYYFTSLKLRALQDDDFDNPGYPAVTLGEKLWSQVDGASQKSCNSCHGSALESMRGIGATFPKFQEASKVVASLEQRINMCRQDQMKASTWANGSEALLSMTAYLKLPSRGVPVDVRADGPAAATFEQGKTLYSTRVGQLGMSCAHCHNDHYNDSYRAEVLSQGHSNGYPAWLAKTQGLVSLHDRFRACYRDMRAEPYDAGSAELVALELYLAWRGKGLPVETPAVRR